MPASTQAIRIDTPLLVGIFVAVIGMTQFMIVLPRAMAEYPGGTIFKADTKGYSWTQNWLSDLGRSEALNNEANVRCSLMFNSSIVVLGSTLVGFFGASLRAFDGLTISSVVMATAGIVASGGLVLIGLTPFDRYPTAHIAGLLFWIIPMVVVALFFSVDSVRSGGAFGWLIAIAGLGLIGGVVVYGIASSTSQVMIMQKMVVALSGIWFSIIAVRISLATIYIMDQTRSRKLIASEQATRYMQEMAKKKTKRFVRKIDPKDLV